MGIGISPDVSYKLYINGATYSNGDIISHSNFKTDRTGYGLKLIDSDSNEYVGIYDNGSNLWIGATSSTGQHHHGLTYISAGHNGTEGNKSIYISIPANGSNSTTHTSYPLVYKDATGTQYKGIYTDADGKTYAMTYELKATVNSGTATRMAYYSEDNAVSAADHIEVLNNYLNSSSRNNKTVDVRINGLIIWGATYGNNTDSNNPTTCYPLLSNTPGVFRFGDGGPQIIFNTSATLGAQAGALIYTDNDAAATGASFHFVTTESSNNNGGNLTVTAPRFRARAGLTVGQNSDNTSYALYVNGSSYFTGAVSVPSTLTVRAENTTNEGGQICLAADPNHNAYPAYLDVCANYFRIHSNGQERFSVNLSSYGTSKFTGLLQITKNSNTVTIGSANANWCHFENSANIPFYFNKAVHVNGDVYYYNTKVHMSSSGFHPPKNGGIYWDPYVESASDASDVTQIIQVASGVAGGTELRIQQANDATDIINLVTPKSIYLNSKEAFNVNDAWLRINENKKFTSGVYFGTSVVRTDGEFWSDSVRIVDNWVGFYNGVQGATRYGYVQANADRMYFRKENGVSTYAFDFNGYIYTSGKLHVASQEDVGLNQNGAVVIGNKSGTNIGIDDNEIMARNNSAASTLYINSEGGQVYTTWLHIQNDSSNNSDDATVLISCQTANDWGLKINKGGKNYGLRVDSLDQGEAIWTNGYVRARCVWANQGSNGERQVGVDSSTSGSLYLYAHTSGKGLYSGSGYKTGSIIGITSSAVTFYGNCTGSAGSVTWANVSSKPAQATRWPTWSEVTSKPSSFTPAGHTNHSSIELFPGATNAGHGGFIDFHFNNSSADYTSRIIEWSSGTLTVYTNLTATKVYNAVWNDFAEFRESDIHESGRVLVSNGSGKLVLSTERLQPAAHIISDTFGCSVGQSDTAQTPMGVAGRVLAYPYQDRNNYKVGDAVCAAPNGTIDIMTREEIIQYPDRIIGIVDEIPNYDIWSQVSTQYDGNGKYGGCHKAEVEVKGRIWVYVR